MERTYDVIILGGGASGLMLASLLDGNKSVLLIDGNSSCGAKIAISGGGRCNLTNEIMGSNFFQGDYRFIDTVLDYWSQKDTLGWFKKHGLIVTKEKNSQYFCANSARDVLSIFNKTTHNIKKIFSCTVNNVSKINNVFKVETNRGVFGAKKVVVATGGLSFPKLGASDIGYRIARAFGHDVEILSPALVGITLQPEQFFLKELSGISTNVRIIVDDRIFDGQLLFAHKGITGPAVMDASLYWTKGDIEINFVPDIEWNEFRQGRKKISSLLPLPKRVARAFLEHLAIDDKIANEVEYETLEKLKLLESYIFSPAGNFGYSKAEVTRGGVSTDQINPYTMESKIVPNLYFIGEVLDVTGLLGGYNLQWAFSSASACANIIDVDV